MMFPSLVLPIFAKTPVEIVLYSDNITEDGAPEVSTAVETHCNFQNVGRKQTDEDGKLTEAEATIYIPGDIFPSIETVTNGEAQVAGRRYRCASMRKSRNPDGTVNYTRIDLIQGSDVTEQPAPTPEPTPTPEPEEVVEDGESHGET